MSSITINDRVHRTKERQDELGTVIEIKENRARILWDGNPELLEKYPQCNTYRPKRTWMSLSAIKIHE